MTKVEDGRVTVPSVVTFRTLTDDVVELSHVGAKAVTLRSVLLYPDAVRKYLPPVGRAKGVLVGVAATVWFTKVEFVP